ncbi:unnamed protein product, partial [Brenthis ino]
MLSSTTDLPTWAQLTEFLESRFRSIEMIDPCKQFVKSSVSNKINQFSKPKSFHSAVQEVTKSSNNNCALCNGSHYIYHCQKFEQKPIKERIDFVQHKRLCFNCMCPNHIVNKCRQNTSCRKCGKKHHTMLHIEKDGSIHQESNTNEGEIHIQKSDKSNTETRIVAHFAQGLQSHNVLLATAIINAHSTTGEKYHIRALLDQGSQASFISESTVQLLNLKRIPVSGVVSGLGDGQTRIKYSVSLLLESRYNPNAKYRVNAYVLGVLTSLLPGDKLCAPKWVHLEQLQLADPGYATPGKIDILLGADVYSEILQNNMVKHPEGNLIAQLTAFGWVLSGRIPRDSLHRKSIINMHIQMRSDDVLRKFWEIEAEPDLIKKKLTVEEEEFINVKSEINFDPITSPLLMVRPCEDEDIVIWFDPGLSPREKNRYYVVINKILPKGSVLNFSFDSDVHIIRITSHDYTKYVKEFLSDREQVMYNFTSDSDGYGFIVKGAIPGISPYLTSLAINNQEFCNIPKVGYFEEIISETNDSGPYSQCGRRKIKYTELIVNGDATKPGDWPWHVAIYNITNSVIRYICGGTLISKYFILTAAHCVTVKGIALGPKSLHVVLGKHNLVGEEQASQEKQVVGWGLDSTDSLTFELRQAKMPIVAKTKCMKSDLTYYGKILNGKKFCAGYHNGTSVCNGDSGSGFHVFVPDEDIEEDDSGAWYVRGIVSTMLSREGASSLCDSTQYAIFTDVEKYRLWIDSYLETERD